ncbi:MAG: hypothetical protein COW18_09545 [Zetaproteobacteria bacterium CG12_big_fil_rev_8_21_14_0_65_54_13]|nr:MAG: hypothetical protein COX55_07745 [Zetaproteobacteria bacterium CG23_combo_of_CG06-09_8_20_14_all_54_7]PIW47082.1 MAG: hypothetical protein COW18_09545 [Zetaproteobacteria bacterium CG12_big_fil_rev_8_21_14_0_65_54_13]PIX53767.1 MAG: hypothetical protein COZ50_11580 [Zetaproteobacteria bacterium CG_4_10_14_3_um_filter_54_28]PJA30634.1 MAG: hypothetical protein CO188_02680 [Zetaproteobacteria bacterium CG_4_9_14_3_um_filter_54_145]
MNYVEVQVEFYFKGECFTPTAIINLDDCMRYEEPVLHIFRLLAAENGIGSYSHEFDVMIEGEPLFGCPTGIAVDYVRDNKLDLDGFREAWLEQSAMRLLQPIADRYLGITDLDEHPRLKAALLAAYQAR